LVANPDPLDESTRRSALDAGRESPATPEKTAPRLRPCDDRPVRLVDRWLAEGQAIVPAEGNPSPRYAAAKRAMDVAGASVLLLSLSPLLFIVWMALMLSGGRPIFRQVRLGHRGRPFTMYKFRTMEIGAVGHQHKVVNEKDGPIFKNRQDPRVTRLGGLLRTTSIDELPQLVNVLLGSMSLVGPRPPLAREVLHYKAWQRRRLAVKPGLTCLWQVSGRSEIGFEDWVRMDLWYLRHQSLVTDLSLLIRTPGSVLSRRGAY
jgi:lipopolysaccharide/colanic/teichoic acid biosynthesis glycosyltransferase